MFKSSSQYSSEAQDLINEEQRLNEKLQKELDFKKAAQVATFDEKFAQRKAARLNKLKEQQEVEKALVGKFSYTFVLIFLTILLNLLWLLKI